MVLCALKSKSNIINHPLTRLNYVPRVIKALDAATIQPVGKQFRMSEVTSSIRERTGQSAMRYRQPMTSTPLHTMLWLSILSGMVVLAVGEATPSEFNTTASESPMELTTTDKPPVPPPREPVTDVFTAPLAAFKVQVPLSPQLAEGEEGEISGLTLGKAENNTDSASTPPFSSIWFNAGQSLGSLTGWLNSRLIPQTTSTTTKPPEVIVRVQSQQAKRKPIISIDGNRKPQGNRIKPEAVDVDEEDEDEDDEDADDEEEYEDGEEEQVDEDDVNGNRYSSNDDEEDNDDEEVSDDEEFEDDEEEDEEPVKKHKKYKKKPNRRQLSNNRRGYDYDEEDYDDDEDYDYIPPNRNSGRQQQQQSLLNRFRQLYSSNNKQQNSVSQSNQPGYRPVRIVQNGQVYELVQDRPSKQQVKRQRRPAISQSSYQLIPIRNNQISNAGQKQKKKNANKPDPANQIVIPLPQGSSSQKKPSQYITIPWAQLGIPSPQKDYVQNGQQASPIIVNIPQQNANRRRRPPQKPTQVVSSPQRKRLRRPLGNRPQNEQLFSVLTEQNLKDIFRIPEIPPSRTPQEENLPITLGGKRKRPINAQSDNVTTAKPAADPESDPDAEDDDDDETQEEQQSYIMVGDDDTADEALPRQAVPKRYLHIGGMKPYVDVLNKGRFYLKSGRQMRMDLGERPESKITSISPERTVVVGKADGIHSLDVTTESASETKVNVPPTIFIVGSEDTSTTGNPLTQ